MFRLYYIVENWSCSPSCYKKNRELPLNETFPMWGNYRMIHNQKGLNSSKRTYYQKLDPSYFLIYWSTAYFFERRNFGLNKNVKHPWWLEMVDFSHAVQIAWKCVKCSLLFFQSNLCSSYISDATLRCSKSKLNWPRGWAFGQKHSENFPWVNFSHTLCGSNGRTSSPTLTAGATLECSKSKLIGNF